jgi:hypothetical protein
MEIKTRKIKDGTELKLRLRDEELLFLRGLFGGLNTKQAEKIADRIEPDNLTYDIYIAIKEVFEP